MKKQLVLGLLLLSSISVIFGDTNVDSPSRINDGWDANDVCPNLCKNHGGWNGPWGQKSDGSGSYCGCKG